MWGLYRDECAVCYESDHYYSGYEPSMTRVDILLASDGACRSNGDPRHRTDRRRGGIGGGIWRTPRYFDDRFKPLIEPISENLARYDLPRITNNFAELQAMLVVLQELDGLIRENGNYHIRKCKNFAFSTDSEYAMNCIFDWVDVWEENARNRNDHVWLNSRNRPVKHQRILEQIINILDRRFNAKTRRSLMIYHCRSHHEDTCSVNKLVDRLARQGSRNY